MRRGVRHLMVGLLALMVAGCTGVPRASAPVVVGPAPNGVDLQADPGLRIQPGGPQPGSSIDQIVRDFLKALTTSDPTYQVAREFLMPEPAKAWKPVASITVIDDAYSAQPDAEDATVSFVATRLARVDSTGQYHVDNAVVEYTFELEQSKGEWRIVNPPTQVMVGQSSFQMVYKAANVYFADFDGKRVVPDIRYFRENLEQRANVLVKALLTGPSPSLVGGVRNELDTPVKLRSAVAYGRDPITVDLTGLGDKNEAQLRVLSAQLVWTLKDLGVSSVRITNDGEPINVPGVGDIQTTADWYSFDPNALPVSAIGYYVAGGAVYDDSATPLPGAIGNGTLQITSAAVSYDSTRIAVVSASGGAPVLRTGQIAQPLSTVDLPGTTSLTPPTWGGSDTGFWIARNGHEAVWVPTTGAPKVVAIPGVAEIGTISQIALSRDSTRMAIIATPPGGVPRLHISTILQTADTLALSAPAPLATDLEVHSVSWYDSRTLAMLARPAPGASLVPFTLLVDDSGRQQLSSPVVPGEPIDIGAAPNRPVLCAVGGNVYRLDDSTWITLIPGTVVAGTKPFYPG